MRSTNVSTCRGLLRATLNAARISVSTIVSQPILLSKRKNESSTSSSAWIHARPMILVYREASIASFRRKQQTRNETRPRSIVVTRAVPPPPLLLTSRRKREDDVDNRNSHQASQRGARPHRHVGDHIGPDISRQAPRRYVRIVSCYAVYLSICYVDRANLFVRSRGQHECAT